MISNSRSCTEHALAQQGVGDLQQHSNNLGPAAALHAEGGLEAFRRRLVRHQVAVRPSCRGPRSCLH